MLLFDYNILNLFKTLYSVALECKLNILGGVTCEEPLGMGISYVFISCSTIHYHLIVSGIEIK